MLGVMYYKAENSKELGEIMKLRKKKKKGRRRLGGAKEAGEGAHYRYRSRTYSYLTQNKESNRLNEPVDRLRGNRTPANCFEDKGTTIML